MKRLLLVISLIICVFDILHSQTQKNKEELYNELVKGKKKYFEKNRKEAGAEILKYLLAGKLESNFDSLVKSGVDTIGIYGNFYSGMISEDSCDCDEIPWSAFIHWKINGNYFVKKIKCNCNFKQIAIPYSTFLNYYEICNAELEKEYIVDAITDINDIKIGSTGKIDSYSLYVSVHVTNHFFFCKMSNNYFFKSFYEEQFNDEGIFYKKNTQTKLFSWWNMIKDEIKEIWGE